MPEDVMNVYLVCSKYNLVGDLDLDSLVSLVFSAWMWIASYPQALLRARCALPQEEKGPGIHCLRMRQFSEIFRKPDIEPGYFRYFNRHSRRGKWDVSAIRGAMSAAEACYVFADALSYSLSWDCHIERGAAFGCEGNI